MASKLQMTELAAWSGVWDQIIFVVVVLYLKCMAEEGLLDSTFADKCMYA